MNNLNLNSLRIFAFAARYGSFKAAGEILNISHGAVSQRIKQLELALGVSLFERTPRGVVLTEVGQDYFRAVEPALSTIADATEDIRCATREVVLHVPPSLASKWLMKRLPDFGKEFPDIRVSTVALEEVVDRPFGKNEVAIRHASDFQPSHGQDCARLTEFQLAVVCHPDLKPAEPVTRLEDLLAMPLLNDAHRRWDRVLAKTRTDAACEIVSFNRTALAIDAALNGQGLAIAPSFLIEQELEDGRLTELWREAEPSGEFLFLIWSAQHSRTAPLSHVINWIRGQFDG